MVSVDMNMKRLFFPLICCTVGFYTEVLGQGVHKDYDEKLAKELHADDCGMKTYVDVELYSWYGSAALKETLKIHSKIEKQSH
ncbi:hypothetical protein H9X96_14080 [Pedobacter sp. N36a]|uniref:hypothetical protein n=1 Tax=Pedobacter sp. N36a TaxID=2767996 RepID=UPI001656D33C|nr:hypothetical protein [Pedobacter sp. N36a]MBC8986900.1 hypothetical protein [Pedobacter sp. N36a]